MKLRSILAACVVAGFSTTAQADFTYTFSGECWFNCSAIGVPPATISGTLNVQDSFAADWYLSPLEVTSFSFDFGNVSITSATHTAGGTGYLVLPGNVLDAAGSLTFTGPGADAGTLSIVGISGWALDLPNNWPWQDPSGPGRYAASNVPEPGTLALLGLGLAGLGLRASRKKK